MEIRWSGSAVLSSVAAFLEQQKVAVRSSDWENLASLCRGTHAVTSPLEQEVLQICNTFSPQHHHAEMLSISAGKKLHVT